MGELFPSAIKSLSAAVESISGEISKTKRLIPASTEINWDEYGESLRALYAHLVQLNTVLPIEYSFDEGLPDDVINYTRLLQEGGAECEQLVEFLLCRDQIFANDTYIKHETDFLKEVLNCIIDHSDCITSVLSVKQ